MSKTLKLANRAAESHPAQLGAKCSLGEGKAGMSWRDPFSPVYPECVQAMRGAPRGLDLEQLCGGYPASSTGLPAMYLRIFERLVMPDVGGTAWSDNPERCSGGERRVRFPERPGG